MKAWSQLTSCCAQSLKLPSSQDSRIAKIGQLQISILTESPFLKQRNASGTQLRSRLFSWHTGAAHGNHGARLGCSHRKDAGYKMGAVAWVKLKIKSRGSCFLLCVTGGTCEPPAKCLRWVWGVPSSDQFQNWGGTSTRLHLEAAAKGQKINRSKHTQSQTHFQC